MTTLTFRTLGAWGAGKGANLEAVEVDNNFWNLAQDIFALQNNPAVPNGIATIAVSGTQMTITLHDGTVLGPYTLPVLTFRWRDEWQPNTSYAVLDVVKVTNQGIYMVQIAHTSGATFDPNLAIGGLPALLQLFGSVDASLGALSDVLLTNLQNGDFLHWQATPAKWENVALGTMALQNANAVAITGGAITGLPTPANPADAATKGYVDALPAGATAADGTMMANIAGHVAPAIPNTLSNYLDHVLATTTRGTLLFRGANGWIALLPGTSGLFLQTLGAGADPIWAVGSAGVTSIAAGPGISTGGATITATGTISLAQIADSSFLGNVLGSTAVPVPLTLTQFLDHALTNARGTVLTRNVTGWAALAPGPSGQYLQSAGAGADLLWGSPLGAGTVTSVAAGAGLTTGGAPITAAGTISFAQISNGTLLANISGATAVPTASTLSLILDGLLSSTQGAVLYRGAAVWSALGPGTAGQFLQTGGAGANPSWSAAAGAAPIGAAQLLANLTAGTALAVGHTLSDILDYVISSARGTLLYRDGVAGWTALPPGTAGQILSTGGPAGDPSWINVPTAKYNIAFSFIGGVLGNAQALGYHKFSKAVTIPANFGAFAAHTSQAGGTANATASTAISVDKALAATPNTFANIGTIIFAAGSVTPSFATSGGATQNFVQGDVMRLIGPATADATFANFYATLVGYET